MDYEKEIPFGAFDSELMHQEINIPEGFEATIEGNKIILTKTESEDEWIRNGIIKYLSYIKDRDGSYMPNNIPFDDMIAWLEKQGQTFTKKDVDDAYLRGISDAKHEFEKQGEQNYLNYENINIQQKDFAPKPKETVKEAESNLTPLERKVKDILFSFHINADDGISFDGTMAIVHNLITLCQQEQKPAWSEEDEKIALGIEQVMICASFLNIVPDKIERIRTWLKSLKERIGG